MVSAYLADIIISIKVTCSCHDTAENYGAGNLIREICCCCYFVLFRFIELLFRVFEILFLFFYY